MRNIFKIFQFHFLTGIVLFLGISAALPAIIYLIKHLYLSLTDEQYGLPYAYPRECQVTYLCLLALIFFSLIGLGVFVEGRCRLKDRVNSNLKDSAVPLISDKFNIPSSSGRSEQWSSSEKKGDIPDNP